MANRMTRLNRNTKTIHNIWEIISTFTPRANLNSITCHRTEYTQFEKRNCKARMISFYIHIRNETIYNVS